MRRLNLGCGSIRRDGWVGIDLAPPAPDDGITYVQHDVVADGIPFTDGHLDVIVANHFLCALPTEQVPPVLAECRRVLAPGGVLRVLVPDLLGAVSAYRRRDRSWFPNLVDRPDVSIDSGLCAYVTWFGTNLSVYTPELLVELLTDAGFRQALCGYDVGGPPEERELDDRARESIIARASGHAPRSFSTRRAPR